MNLKKKQKKILEDEIQLKPIESYLRKKNEKNERRRI